MLSKHKLTTKQYRPVPVLLIIRVTILTVRMFLIHVSTLTVNAELSTGITHYSCKYTNSATDLNTGISQYPCNYTNNTYNNITVYKVERDIFCEEVDF